MERQPPRAQVPPPLPRFHLKTEQPEQPPYDLSFCANNGPGGVYTQEHGGGPGVGGAHNFPRMDPLQSNGNGGPRQPSPSFPHTSAAGGLPQGQAIGVVNKGGMPYTSYNYWMLEVQTVLSNNRSQINALQDQLVKVHQTALAWQNKAECFEKLALSQHAEIEKLKTELCLATNNVENVGDVVGREMKRLYEAMERLDGRVEELQKEHSEHKEETTKIREDVDINVHRQRTNEMQDYIGMMFTTQSACLPSAIARAIAGVGLGAVNDGREGNPCPNTEESQEEENVNVEDTNEVEIEVEDPPIPPDQVKAPLKLRLKKRINGIRFQESVEEPEAQGREDATLPIPMELQETQQTFGFEGNNYMIEGIPDLLDPEVPPPGPEEPIPAFPDQFETVKRGRKKKSGFGKGSNKTGHDVVQHLFDQGVFVCTCGVNLSSKFSLYRHLKLRNETKKERKEYKCLDCDKVFMVKGKLKSHRLTAH